ncbi:hypothetical protein GUJ93_ZPchr0001g31532 [Zizania palustris]|uniref:Uncharacterized protein n=1 Tax=Zizania palustris TaxID=103762 RepID=A0A8J5RQ49_ZIZPA|nr:hypothetical protein GUJ93_ZPchr0001g31532 [Zizania palustris]
MINGMLRPTQEIKNLPGSSSPLCREEKNPAVDAAVQIWLFSSRPPRVRAPPPCRPCVQSQHYKAAAENNSRPEKLPWGPRFDTEPHRAMRYNELKKRRGAVDRKQSRHCFPTASAAAPEELPPASPWKENKKTWTAISS